MRVSRQFYFLYEKISHTEKAQKAQNVNKQLSLRFFFIRTKSIKSTKRKQATFTQTFYIRIKSIKNTKNIKSTKRQTSHVLLLRCFLCAQKYCV